MSDHPPIDSLARFATGLLPPQETVTVALHVASCTTCQAAATRPEPELGPGPEGEPTSPYAAAIRRVAERSGRRVARHQRASRRAPGLLDQLLELPTEEWDRAIRSSPRFHSYAFARQVLASSKAGWTEDPARSQRLAELALEVTNRLPHVEYGRRNLNDLRSKAWAFVANSRRIRGQFAEVPLMFGAASELLLEGSGLAADRAQLIGLTISYCIDTERFAEAEELSLEVEEIAGDLSSRSLEARNLIKVSRIDDLLGRYDRKLATAHRVERLLLDRRYEHLRGIFLVGLAYAMAQAGDPSDARSILASLDASFRTGERCIDWAHRDWVDGQVCRIMGDLDECFCLLRRSRRTFVEVGLPLRAAFVDLDLAETYIDLGHYECAVRLVSDALPLFVLHGLQRDISEALDIFRRAGGLG